MSDYNTMLEEMAGRYFAKTNHTAVELAERIRADKIPHIARFGDGEIQCALEFPGGNCDGQPYSKPFGLELLRSLRVFARTPGLWLGNWAWLPYSAWLHSIAEGEGQKDWIPHEVFMLLDLYDPIPVRDIFIGIRANGRRKVIVRPVEIQGADAFLQADGITCPSVNCWASFMRLQDTVFHSIKDDDLVLLCCGMAAKPLMANILESGVRCRVMDIGSGLDPIFKSRPSRERQLSIDRIRELFLGLVQER